MSEHREPIPSRIYNSAVGGHVCGSNDIIDDDLGLEQNAINKEVSGSVPYDQANPNGMGRVVLKENDNFKEVIEAQTDGNTIFVIKYDFTLTDNVTIPANCILNFQGGSISGAYTVTGNNTGIQAGLVKIFNTNVILAGTWNITEVIPEWFGAIADGVTDSINGINKALNFVTLMNKGVLKLQIGTYCISSGIKLSPLMSIEGTDRNKTIIKKTSIENEDDSVIELLDGKGSSQYGSIGNLTISGVSDQNPNMFGIQATKNYVPYLYIHDINIDGVKRGIHIGYGTWLCTIERVKIYEGEIGIYIEGTSTSCNISNIYVMGASVSAYILIGIQYSIFDTLCADFCHTNGYVYKISFTSATFIGCGSESTDSKEQIYLDNNSRCTFINCTFFHSSVENGTIIHIYDASAKFDNCKFGYNGEHPSSVYKTDSISYLYFDNCTVYGTYTKSNTTAGTIQSRNNGGLVAYKQNQSAIGAVNGPGDLAPNNVTRAIYTDGINATSSSQGHSEWSFKFNKGDIILNNKPNINGIFAWESLNDPSIQKTLVGTISEVISSNTVKLTSLAYNTTVDDGMHIMVGDTLDFSNGYAGEVTDVNYATNTISLWRPSGTAQVGTGGVLRTSPYRMKNRFASIAMHNVGISQLRPSSPASGIQYFDTTLGKPIWWNGSAWVDATGATV